MGKRKRRALLEQQRKARKKAAKAFKKKQRHKTRLRSYLENAQAYEEKARMDFEQSLAKYEGFKDRVAVEKRQFKARIKLKRMRGEVRRAKGKKLKAAKR